MLAANTRIVDKLDRELGEISEHLQDAQVTEVAVNPNGLIYIERVGQSMTLAGEITPERAESIISTAAALHNETIGQDSPTISCELPGGSRFQAWLPPVVSAPAFCIRKHADIVHHLSDFVAAEVIASDAAEAIRAAVAGRKNILVAGGTGAGKTTLLNALVEESTSGTDDNQRLFILEDTREIQTHAKNAVFLKTSDSMPMVELVRSTLRGRPDRIYIGEIRSGDAGLETLKAWNTGHPGGASTIHANDCRTALWRMEMLLHEAVSGDVKSLIAEAIDLVVNIRRTDGISAGRQVDEIIEVNDYNPATGKFVTRSIA